MRAKGQPKISPALPQARRAGQVDAENLFYAFRRDRLEFTCHRQEVFNPCANYESRAASILGSDANQSTFVCFSGNVKYPTPADTLKYWWADSLSFNHY